jgi:hypothetical protein
MLSVESQIIDATTEDGKRILHEIDEHEKRAMGRRKSGTDTNTTEQQSQSTFSN